VIKSALDFSKTTAHIQEVLFNNFDSNFSGREIILFIWVDLLPPSEVVRFLAWILKQKLAYYLLRLPFDLHLYSL
jgi:hypothetical protein